MKKCDICGTKLTVFNTFITEDEKPVCDECFFYMTYTVKEK